MFPYSRVVLVEIELIIGLFSAYKVMEPQRNYMEKLYNPGKYKLIWMLCCYFFCITYLFYICEHVYFVTLMKYILELLEILFCENMC